MPSTYSSNLRVELIGTGEQSGTWGTTTNTNLGTILESAISGYESVSVTSTSQALTALNGTADQSRNMTINLSSASPVAADFTIYIPPAEKFYVIRNNTTYKATISAATALNGTTPTGGTTVEVPSGKTMIVFCDSNYVREALSYVSSLSAGSLTLTTPLSLASGGLPTQTNFASCFLSTDGTTAYWGVTGIKTALVATTANITLSGLQTVDGVSLVAGNRVLVKNQTAAAENGIYVVVDPGAWTRAKDFDYDLEIAGSIVNVQAGTSNGGKQYATSFKAGQTLGTDVMNWASVEPLPSQTGNTSKVLTTDGSVAAWTSPAAKVVYVATTANLTSLSGLATTIDGILINTAGTRVLVKNQTATADNGIYIVASGAWSRADDANTAASVAGSLVIVQAGSANGGTQWSTSFKSSDTLGSTTMPWSKLSTTGTIPVSQGGTGLTTIPAKSILVANTLDTLTTVAPAAGQSIRINAGNTAWEAYTPSTGGTGVTQVTAGSGMSFSAITSTGSVTMGSPADITTTSSNGFPTSSTHSHKLVTTGLALTSDFTGSNQSLAANGYQKLPGGLIIQWGVITGSSPQSVTFSTAGGIAFPTACYSLTANVFAASGVSPLDRDVTITALSSTGFTVYYGGSGTAVYWMAIGK